MALIYLDISITASHGNPRRTIPRATLAARRSLLAAPVHRRFVVASRATGSDR
jgi:hypothetical protein